MHTYHSIKSLQQEIRKQTQSGKTIGLVPTMGNLHDGHLQLITEAREHCDFVVSSVFVNPMQFGRGEDMDAYPRTLQQDESKLAAANCDALFAPDYNEMYPDGLDTQTVVSVPALSARHCGASRPGHFAGVATVVSKLFNIVRPDKAVFGMKDYQQFRVIQKMVADLCFPIEIIGVETWRESSGLAMSSRNGYLTAEQHQTATVIYQSLLQAKEDIIAGAKDFARLEDSAKHKLTAAGLRTDYFTICDAETLEPASTGDNELVILVAAYLGSTRLIDNVRCSLTAKK